MTDEEVGAWLQGLNDARLTLGTRLGVGEDVDAELRHEDPDSSRFGGLEIYDWLSVLQESLVRVLAGD